MRDSPVALTPRARILEITSYPPPRAGWGVRVSFLRANLLAQGHDCHVLNIGKSRSVPAAEYVSVLGLWDYVLKVLRFLRRGYMIHTHINGDGNKGWLLALIAQLACRVHGRPLVLTFHAGPLQRLFPRARSGIFTPLLRLLFHLPHQIICNDDNVKRGIMTYGVAADKIYPIPAFSRQYMEYHTVALPGSLEDFIQEAQPLVVVYFFLRPEFFVASMIEALSILGPAHPQLRTVMVGAGSDQPELAARLVEAGLVNQVYCAGDLDHDQFMTLLARAHFYLRTPSRDGVCSSVLEALSLGVPVLASENGRRPPSVITFPADDAGALAAELRAAWNRYADVRASVIRPDIEDTVSVETALLLALGTRPPGSAAQAKRAND